MRTTSTRSPFTLELAGRPQRALPAPRSSSCDACERPADRHELKLYELRGVEVLGLCPNCRRSTYTWSADRGRLGGTSGRPP